MAATFSTYLRDNILNIFRGTAYPSLPSNFYVATFSVAPSRNGTGGTENTNSIRTAGRVAIACSSAEWDAIASVGDARETKNTNVVDFGNAVNSVSVAYIGIFDAATGGNFWGGVATAFTSTAGTPVNIAAGVLRISLD